MEPRGVRLFLCVDFRKPHEPQRHADTVNVGESKIPLSVIEAHGRRTPFLNSP